MADIIKLDEEEYKSIELIITKIGITNSQLEMIPQGVSDDDKKIYIQTITDMLGNYRWLEKDWWNSIYEKYNLDRSVPYKLDFENKTVVKMEV